ncbi:unnamed protein product, partial [Porites lobata]
MVLGFIASVEGHTVAKKFVYLAKVKHSQLKYTWLLPLYVKQVDYARVHDINFTSAKKMKFDLDASIDNVPNDSFPE